MSTRNGELELEFEEEYEDELEFEEEGEEFLGTLARGAASAATQPSGPSRARGPRVLRAIARKSGPSQMRA